MLTAGQVAPQAQPEESANDRTRSEAQGPKRDRFPYRIRCKSPLLSVFFLKSEPYVHRPARKVVRQKKRTSDKRTDKSGQISSSAGTRFWTAKCQIPVAKPLKSSPQNEQPISLKKSTNGHLRLVRSLALSSSCACGATTTSTASLPYESPQQGWAEYWVYCHTADPFLGL